MVSVSIILFVFTSNNNYRSKQNKNSDENCQLLYEVKVQQTGSILKKQLLSALGPSEQVEKRKMAIESEITKRQKPSCQQISSFYAENFNIVDRFNGLWYDIKWPHTNMKSNNPCNLVNCTHYHH